jgi:hypothetical protein
VPLAFILVAADNPGMATVAPSTKPKQFVKDIIRAGSFIHPRTGVPIEVDEDRMDHWVATFKQVLSDGFDIEATVDHSTSADDVVGYVRDMYRDGETLMAVFEFPGERGQELAKTVKNVSVEIMPEWKKGDGKVYQDALSRVSIVQEPVIGKQSKFQALSARVSKTGGIFLSAIAKEKPKMDLKELATKCGVKLADGMADDEIASELVKKFTEMNDELSALKNKPADPEMNKEMAALSAQVVGLKVDKLVTDGNILPAVASGLKAALAGTAEAPNVILLSSKAGKTPAYEAVITALAGNKAIDLTEQSQAQNLSALPKAQAKASEADAIKADIEYLAKLA